MSNKSCFASPQAGNAVEDRQLLNLTQATENLGLDSPAFNLRKRKSLSDSTHSETSLDSSGGKRSKRLSVSNQVFIKALLVLFFKIGIVIFKSSRF